jgi:hypothetical protein
MEADMRARPHCRINGLQMAVAIEPAAIVEQINDIVTRFDGAVVIVGQDCLGTSVNRGESEDNATVDKVTPQFASVCGRRCSEFASVRRSRWFLFLLRAREFVEVTDGQRIGSPVARPEECARQVTQAGLETDLCGGLTCIVVGKKRVKQIAFQGERFDVMSVRRWRERVFGLTHP